MLIRIIFFGISCFFQLSSLSGQGLTSDHLLRSIPVKPDFLAERVVVAKVYHQSPCVVLPAWSVGELPLFCKIEHQVAKHLPVAILFRLGSVDYVNWLEGKPGYDVPQGW